MKLNHLGIILALLCMPFFGYAQILINEIQHANLSAITDEDGDYRDWFELYNAGAQPVSLAGYGLSDRIDEPLRWIMPDSTLQPGDFMLIWASGKDRGSLSSNNATSLHTNFSLTSGESLLLSNASGVILNQVVIPLTAADFVYRRQSDGGPQWCFSSTLTPGSSNAQGTCATGFEPKPVFSQGSGMYPGSVTITLSSPSPGAIIRYTVDGSVPNESSVVYSTPLTVNETVVISARAFGTNGLLPSFTEKNTYMISESGLAVPVICISTNPENLWDENIGIYVFGPPDYGGYPYFGANFWEDWERESYIEYYTENGDLEFEGPVGLKIHGGWSRGQAQKSFRILARDDYGMESIDYPLIPDKPEITSYRSFNLRNGGNEYGGPRYHDALMQRAMKSTEADYMGYSPVVTFLNGEYWGMYELREHLNEDYVEANHGVETNESTVISYNYMGFNVINGDPAPFYELYNWAISNDPLGDGFFEGLSSRVDVENYIDYVIAQTYYGNGDWSNGYLNNYKFWHDDRPGGKWRFMLMDLDFGLSAGVCDNFIVQAGNDWFEPDQIFNAAIQNPEFRDAFIRRYIDLRNTVFRTERLAEIRDSMRAELEDAMPRHCERWQTDFGWWYNGYDWRLDWNNQRRECIINVLQDYFGLFNDIEITLDVQPAGAGRIHISTVEPDEMEYPWTGAWYNGLPVTLTAIANPGYVFSHWGENQLFEIPVTNRQFTLNLEENTSFTAHFSGSPAVDYAEISEVMYNPGEQYPSQDWVEIHNTLDIPLDLSSFVLRDGRFYHTTILGTNALIPPGGRIVLAQDPVAFSTVYEGLESASSAWSFGLNNQGDEIRLLDRNGNAVIQFTYLDEAPWPADADGEGPSMEYNANIGEQDNPFAWFEGCPGGSPYTDYDPNCGTVSISEPTTAGGISVYPNPASEQVWIRLPKGTSGTVSIIDVTGKRVAEQSFGVSNVLSADVSMLLSGMYIVQIRTATTSSEHQLIIQSR